MFLTTRQLYFKWNISSAWDCAITFTWASSGKKDVILGPIVQMVNGVSQSSPNTWKYSGSASPDGTPSPGPAARRWPRQLSWDDRGCYSNLTPFCIKQQHLCFFLVAKRCDWGVQRCSIWSSARSKKHINMFPRGNDPCLNDPVDLVKQRWRAPEMDCLFVCRTKFGHPPGCCVWSLIIVNEVKALRNSKQQFSLLHWGRNLGIISAVHRQIYDVVWRTESSRQSCVISDLSALDAFL